MPKIVFVLVYCIAVLFLSGCGNTEPSQEQKDASYISLNQDRMKDRLKDPDSAQFRNSFVSRSGGAPVVCGEINAKTSFGGYGGFKRFISAGDIQIVETDMAPGEMDKTWAKLCGR